MSQTTWTDVDRYIGGLFAEEDEALAAAQRDSLAAGLPAISVSAAQGKLLHVLARSVGSKRILEIGTLGGYSTIWLARALPPGGELISLEYESRHVEVSRTNIARAGLSRVVTIVHGRADESLARLVGPFDFIFIDADKPGYPAYLEACLKLSRPGTMIVADNVVRSGAVTDADSRDSLIQGIRRFNEVLAAEPRVSATILQTVGQKGHDGLAIATVISV